LQAIDNVANRFCLLSWVAIVGKILPHKWPALPMWGSFALEPLMCRSYTDIRPLSHELNPVNIWISHMLEGPNW
jgi:hypothetical protein